MNQANDAKTNSTAVTVSPSLTVLSQRDSVAFVELIDREPSHVAIKTARKFKSMMEQGGLNAVLGSTEPEAQ